MAIFLSQRLVSTRLGYCCGCALLTVSSSSRLVSCGWISRTIRNRANVPSSSVLALFASTTTTSDNINNDNNIMEDHPTLSWSTPLHPNNHNNNDDSTIKTALIILNTPISNPPSPVFQQLWNMASYRVCADGGANRLYDATVMKTTPNYASSPQKQQTQQENWIPDLIKGDLDSLRQDVAAYYQSHNAQQHHHNNVAIVKDPCQDTNDLDKALQSVQTHFLEKEEKEDPHKSIRIIIIYGAFGGRMDQEMASFQALYKWGPVFQNASLWLYNDENAVVWIPPQTNIQMTIPCYDRHNPTTTSSDDTTDTTASVTVTAAEGPTCGLIPLGRKCDSIITRGLQWDLDGNVPLEFGGLVSTSNRVMKPVVTIMASHSILFSLEIVLPPRSTIASTMGKANEDNDIEQ